LATNEQDRALERVEKAEARIRTNFNTQQSSAHCSKKYALPCCFRLQGSVVVSGIIPEAFSWKDRLQNTGKNNLKN